MHCFCIYGGDVLFGESPWAEQVRGREVMTVLIYLRFLSSVFLCVNSRPTFTVSVIERCVFVLSVSCSGLVVSTCAR